MSGKYLYSVARPIPLSLATCDIVTPLSPCWATSAAVASRTASRTASRCAAMVSLQILGMHGSYSLTFIETL